MRKGWFKIHGVQDGDRSVEDQLKGLGPMLDEVAGKSVLDLGSAEGLIAREAAHRGAASVVGIEVVPDAVAQAREQCKGLACRFECADLRDVLLHEIAGHEHGQYDVVLALAILHKLPYPFHTAALAAAACRDLMVIRLPSSIITDSRSGFRPHDVPSFMRAVGFRFDHEDRGHLDEWMGYFRRVHG